VTADRPLGLRRLPQSRQCFFLVRLIGVRRRLAPWLVIAVAGLLASQGCRGSAGDAVINASSLPSELAPLPGAIDIKAHTQPGGLIWVHYDLTEPFPARSALRAICDRFQSTGWSPLAYSWLNPTIPSSHTRGWTSFIGGPDEPRAMVDQWMAEWRNKAGAVVMYEFRYVSPSQSFARSPDEPDNTRLRVTGMLASASLARRFVAESATHAPPSK
jgi:hypothetical protein